eukprot:543377-Lingulodinium_polyedra.AAC.1
MKVCGSGAPTTTLPCVATCLTQRDNKWRAVGDHEACCLGEVCAPVRFDKELEIHAWRLHR